MSSIAEDIDEQVAMLERLVTCPVTGDPRQAFAAEKVAVLVDPPTRDYVEQLQTWQIVILRNTSDLGIDTTRALSEVLAQLEASELHMEEARPGVRRTGTERGAVPCYLIRYTTA